MKDKAIREEIAAEKKRLNEEKKMVKQAYK